MSITTFEELVVLVGVCYFFCLANLIFSLVLFWKLDNHLFEDKRKKREKELIDKTRSEVFNDLCAYFERTDGENKNEKQCKKE